MTYHISNIDHQHYTICIMPEARLYTEGKLGLLQILKVSVILLYDYSVVAC